MPAVSVSLSSPSRLLLLLLLVALRAQRLSAAAAADAAARRRADAAREGAPTVTAFVYGWYSTPAVDGAWGHWNHSLLPHWTAQVRAQYPAAAVSWRPPADLHSPFYPRGGPYSSADEARLRGQLAALRGAGVAAAAVSWWGRAGASAGDSQGVRTEGFFRRAVAQAEAALALGAAGAVRVAPHLEPYAGRDAASLRADIAALSAAHGESHAWLRVGGRRVFFVYDSYHLPPAEWARLLTPGGDLSVRGDAAVDGFFIGLWLEREHGAALAAGGFDGAYTYFASAGFSYGSTPANWPSMRAEAEDAGLLFVPCVGPGYDDTRIRPWNRAATRAREGGAYYERMWRAAIASGAHHVGITSFNEWGEGTQIEAAEPRTVDVAALAPTGAALDADLRAVLGARDAYEDYSPHGPDYYLELTHRYADDLARTVHAERARAHAHARSARARAEAAGESKSEL